MMPLQQTAFENFVTKEENCSKRAISPFDTMFSTQFKSMSSFRELSNIIFEMFSKLSVADLLYVGKEAVIMWIIRHLRAGRCSSTHVLLPDRI